VKTKKMPDLPAGELSPRCRHFGPCGGCTLQHVAYEEQLRWKEAHLRKILEQEMDGRPLPPIEVIPTDDPWGYRSKMEFSFGEEKGRLTLGLHERGNFRKIVEVERCEIAPEPVSRLLVHVRRIAERFPLRSYHPSSNQGFWRHAVIRSTAAGKLLFLLMTHEGPREPAETLARELPAQVPELQSFYWGISTRVSDVARPERLERMFGEERLEDEIAGIRYQVGPVQFLQPNLRLVPRVYQAIRDRAALTGQETVYDLYCGIGLIALLLAKQARAVVGVECEPDSIASAERNAELNGISNALFFCGKTEDLLKGGTLFKQGPRPDCIVLDPPRVGLHKEMIVPILQSGCPRLLYLSCNPASLARDLKLMLERVPAYRVDSLQLFDFFPHTTHLETLAVLRR